MACPAAVLVHIAAAVTLAPGPRVVQQARRAATIVARASDDGRLSISYTDARTLEVVAAPPTALSASAAKAAFLGVWLGSCGSMTGAAIAARSLVFGAWMLPFWVAGGVVASELAQSAAHTAISLGDYAWSVRSTLAGVTVRSAEGTTADLDHATVEQDGDMQFHLMLVETDGSRHAILSGHSVGDLQLLSDLLQDRILEARDRRVAGGDELLQRPSSLID